MLREALFHNATHDEVNAALRAALALVQAQTEFEGADHPIVVNERFGLMDIHSLISTARDGMSLGHIPRDQDHVFATTPLSFARCETLAEACAIDEVNAIVTYTRDGRWTHVPHHPTPPAE